MSNKKHKKNNNYKKNDSNMQLQKPKGTVIYMDCGDTMATMELPFLLKMAVPQKNVKKLNDNFR